MGKGLLRKKDPMMFLQGGLQAERSILGDTSRICCRYGVGQEWTKTVLQPALWLTFALDMQGGRSNHALHIPSKRAPTRALQMVPSGHCGYRIIPRLPGSCRGQQYLSPPEPGPSTGRKSSACPGSSFWQRPGAQ